MEKKFCDYCDRELPKGEWYKVIRIRDRLEGRIDGSTSAEEYEMCESCYNKRLGRK